MASEESGKSGLSYSYLIQLAEDEADRIEVFEKGATEAGWRISDFQKQIQADQLKKAAGYRALGRMARHVKNREFGVFTKGGMQ